MSNIKDFLEKLQSDKTMQDALAQARMDATIAVAGKYGFAITESDFKAMSENLSDEELATVPGGQKLRAGLIHDICELNSKSYAYTKAYIQRKRQKPPAIHIRKLAVSVVDIQLSKTPVALLTALDTLKCVRFQIP